MLPGLLILLRIALAICTLLCFHVNFKIVFSLFLLQQHQNFHGDCIESVECLSRIAIFTTLFLKIREHHCLPLCLDLQPTWNPVSCKARELRFILFCIASQLTQYHLWGVCVCVLRESCVWSYTYSSEEYSGSVFPRLD